MHLDGTGLTLMDPGDGHHLSVLSPAHQFVVDNCSRFDQAPVSAPKGEWTRVGIRCEGDRVFGYLNGKVAVKQRAEIREFDLALYTDPGVTAQFDDVAYWAPK